MTFGASLRLSVNPGFEHVRSTAMTNPAEVVLSVVVKRDLDTRLVEALPWVLSAYTDLNLEWLRSRAKLHNAQNRLGYLMHLATQTARALPEHARAAQISKSPFGPRRNALPRFHA
jgi:hypothetical protein